MDDKTTSVNYDEIVPEALLTEQSSPESCAPRQEVRSDVTGILEKIFEDKDTTIKIVDAGEKMFNKTIKILEKNQNKEIKLEKLVHKHNLDNHKHTLDIERSRNAHEFKMIKIIACVIIAAFICASVLACLSIITSDCFTLLLGSVIGYLVAYASRQEKIITITPPSKDDSE